jgi:hypothetical protein
VSGKPTMELAQSGLLAALDAYVACLGARQIPVPYVLRDELRLRRGSLRADREPLYARSSRPGPS